MSELARPLNRAQLDLLAANCAYVPKPPESDLGWRAAKLEAMVVQLAEGVMAKKFRPYEEELIRRLNGGRDCLPIYLALERYGAAGTVEIAAKGADIPMYRARAAIQKLWSAGHLERLDEGQSVRYRAVRWQPGQKAKVAA